MARTSPDDMFGLDVECFEAFSKLCMKDSLFGNGALSIKKNHHGLLMIYSKNSSSLMYTVNLTEILNTASIR